LKELAGGGSQRSTFARLALLAFDVLKRVPDPDMALNNWERFMRSLGSSEFHYNLLLSQPMRLEILLNILAGSQFLSDTLIRNPVFLDWVTVPRILHQERTREEMEEDLRGMKRTARGHQEWLNRLRRFRKQTDQAASASWHSESLEAANSTTARISISWELWMMEEKRIFSPMSWSP
jgi:glutamate-ammonia-ligase adenylyltransferase